MDIILYCVVDGQSTPFPVEISSAKTVGHLKHAIKDENANELRDVDAKQLTLWKVSIPATDDEEIILLDNVAGKDKKKLGSFIRLSKVFPKELPQETVHIIVQRPPRGNTTCCRPLAHALGYRVITS